MILLRFFKEVGNILRNWSDNITNIVLTLLGIGVITYGIVFYLNARDRLENGQFAIAKVIDTKEYWTYDNDVPDHHCIVIIQYDGYQSKIPVPISAKCQVGTSFEVYYYPENPLKVSANDSSHIVFLIATIGVGILIVLVATMTYWT